MSCPGCTTTRPARSSACGLSPLQAECWSDRHIFGEDERLTPIEWTINPQVLPQTLADAPDLIDVLERADRFISGFEDDLSQCGVPALLADLRQLRGVRSARHAVAQGRGRCV